MGLFLYGYSSAQPDMAWIRLRYNHSLSGKWDLYGESDIRPFIRSGDMFQYLFRIGVARQLENGLKLDGGTAWFHSVRSQGGRLVARPVNESRLFLGLSGKHAQHKYSWLWRVMLEERSFSNSTPALRFRYQLGIAIHLPKFSLLLADEYFHQYRYSQYTNRYDQNRILFYLQLPWKKGVIRRLELGPMYIMQPQSKPGILVLRLHLIAGGS